MNPNFRGRVSVVATMTRLRAGRFIPRNPGRAYDLPPLKNIKTELFSVTNAFSNGFLIFTAG